MEAPEKVLEKIRTSDLLGLYEGLLSEKQVRILRLYNDEDLGFSEIAEELGITRQAVYDATQQGKAALEKFEKRLGLLQTSQSGTLALREIPSPQNPEMPTEDKEEIRRIFRLIEKAAGEDIIYDTRKLRSQLNHLKRLLWPQETDAHV